MNKQLIVGAGFALATVMAVSGCSGTSKQTSPSPTGGAPITTPTTTPVPTNSPVPTTAPPVTSNAPVAGTALAAVDALTVKGRAPKTGYTREQYGAAWTDVDKNGCDTRNDVLRRDLTDVTYKDGSTCVLASGVLVVDPYTGNKIVWTRGQDTSSAIQIDHAVALSDAWQKGAAQWTADQRLAFANDPLNLISADGPANMSKGDGDTATWLPPNTAYRCAYVARQVAVKQKYGAWVTDAEKQAMVNVLSTCPNEPLPTEQSTGVTVPPRNKK